MIANKLYSIQTSNLNTWTAEGFNDLQQTYNKPIINIQNKRIIVDGEIKIYDFTGEFITDNKDISDIRPGIYIIIVITDRGNYSQKIQIQ